MRSLLAVLAAMWPDMQANHRSPAWLDVQLQPDMSIAPTKGSSTSPTIPGFANRPHRDVIGWLGPVITATVLSTALWQLRALNPTDVLAMLPRTPLFWIVFAADYLLGPACDYLIFRYLWRVPPQAFVALVRKMVSNQLVASYVGEAHFYAWARARTRMVAAPFAAIKDVAILSALSGNLATLLLLAITLPLLKAGPLAAELPKLLLSAFVVMLGSSIILLNRQTLFSLDSVDLWRVGGLQAMRVLVHVVLVALAWHLAMPGQNVTMWLLLSALAMLLSRLPFVPNSGLALAGIAAVLFGQNAEVTRLLAMMAGLVVTTHIAVGLPLFAREVLAWRR